MKHRNLTQKCMVFLVAFCMLLSATQCAQPPDIGGPQDTPDTPPATPEQLTNLSIEDPFLADTVIVGFTGQYAAKDFRTEDFANIGCTALKPASEGNYATLTLESQSKQTVLDALAQLNERPEVAYAYPKLTWQENIFDLIYYDYAGIAVYLLPHANIEQYTSEDFQEINGTPSILSMEQRCLRVGVNSTTLQTLLNFCATVEQREDVWYAVPLTYESKEDAPWYCKAFPPSESTAPTEKIYEEINMRDDFAPNQVYVTVFPQCLPETYTIDDFQDIGCTKFTKLYSEYGGFRLDIPTTTKEEVVEVIRYLEKREDIYYVRPAYFDTPD